MTRQLRTEALQSSSLLAYERVTSAPCIWHTCATLMAINSALCTGQGERPESGVPKVSIT